MTLLDQILTAPNGQLRTIPLAPVYMFCPHVTGLALVLGTVPPGTDLTEATLAKTKGVVTSEEAPTPISATIFKSHAHAMHFCSEMLAAIEKAWPVEAAALVEAGKAAGAL